MKIWGNKRFTGTYTPVATDLVNIDSTAFQPLQFSRVGDIVTVFGRMSANATTAGVQATFKFPPPIESAFTSDSQCGGTSIEQIVDGTAPLSVGAVYSVVDGNIEVMYLPNTATNRWHYINFSYVVV